MPGRYEMVDEPESMEVVDDDVYHPELTVRESGGGSMRSLEPIIGGPIGLKTIFYDPRWSTRQRRCCVGIVLSVSFCCLAILISLMVGLGKVISYINYNEQMKKSGLYMIPNVAEYETGNFVYKNPNGSKPNDRFRALADRYIQEIDDYLEKYRAASQKGSEYSDCRVGETPGKNKRCRFNLQSLGTNCTKENKYGYYEGTPCILFSIRNVRKWTPDVSQDFLNTLNGTTVPSARFSNLNDKSLPLMCHAALIPGYSTPLVGHETFEYYPPAGFDTAFLKSNDMEEKPQLAPLMFVQLQKLDETELHIDCRLLAKNIQNLNGVRVVKFEYNNASPDSDVGLEPVVN